MRQVPESYIPFEGGDPVDWPASAGAVELDTLRTIPANHQGSTKVTINGVLLYALIFSRNTTTPSFGVMTECEWQCDNGWLYGTKPLPPKAPRSLGR